MNRRRYSFRYRFHPVGQGLFSSGDIDGPERNRLFRWVYDCGTNSTSSLIDDGISLLEASSGNRRRLDLVALSHFDNDHINGMARLISKLPIHTLILPYMQLWKRFLIAFEETMPPTAPLMGFFVNPVAYLTGLPGAQITRILFVFPTGEDREGPPLDEGVNPDDNIDEWNMTYESDRHGDPEQPSLLRGTEKTQVDFLKGGSAIKVASRWEFVPYNDEAPDEFPDTFRGAVDAERDRLLNAKTLEDRQAVLKELKITYENQFKGRRSHNTISLFVYGGPIYRSWDGTGIWGERSAFWSHTKTWNRYLFAWGKILIVPNCSILYPGDGYLDEPKKIDRMIRFLKPARINWTAAFQVMHHGAKGNWHEGVAQQIAPAFSIFCSNPERKGWHHPHALVLRDFWRYGPIQVDKTVGAMIHGWMWKQ